MKLAMTLLVRDNADVIEANLRYHLAQGVDIVLVTDNGSRDGTVEILERYRGRGVAEIWHEHTSDFDQSGWVTKMARHAATAHRADWVINNDADELWWPKEGDLKAVFEAIAPEFGLLVVPRTNFVPRPDDERHPFERMTLRELRARKAQSGLLPKTAHRGVSDIYVGHGAHRAAAPGLAPVPYGDPIHVFHYSRRSFAQYEQRIRNAAEIMRGDPEADSNATAAWREGFRHLRDGTLREHYERFVVDDAAAPSRIASGDLVVDRRIAHFLRVNGLLSEQEPASAGS